MSEVEKMYRNAKVMIQDCLCGFYCVFDKSNKNIVNEKCKTRFCAYLDDNSFTAEKQIALIKWLMKYDEIHGDYNDEYGFSTLNYSGKYKKDFEESLASVINNELWQDLTESEQEQIRSILNG